MGKKDNPKKIQMKYMKIMVKNLKNKIIILIIKNFFLKFIQN
jgi:hypothetical protein